jgi:hypothetical protein
MSLTLRPHVCCSLTEPIVALEFHPERRSTRKPLITKLAAGTTVEIESPTPDASGMIQVSHDGIMYAVFATDLQERGEK